MKNKLYRIIKNIFIFIWLILLITMIFLEKYNYPNKINHLIPNIIIILLSLLVIIFIKKIKIKKISNKKFNILLLVLFIITFTIQMIITTNIYFKTGWDVEVIELYKDVFFKSNEVKNIYMTIYPNNILILFIYVIINTISKNYLIMLIFNNLIVSISSLLTCLTIKRITKNNVVSLLSYIFIIPLITLSPWNTITYTDTLGMLFPILVLFLYCNKNKKLHNWLLITIISFISLLLKPTLFIIYIAIFIIETINFINRLLLHKKTKEYKYIIISLIVGILSNLLISTGIKSYLNYEPFYNIESFNILHYIAMGQNDKTNGIYNKEDVYETLYKGNDINKEKIISRITNRSFISNIIFHLKKLMINYNDGTFAWTKEGDFFKEVKNNNSKLSILLKDYYYPNGKQYKLFTQITQIFWIIIITSIFLLYFVKNNKRNIVIITTIIGITLFLVIFEARARYLYCYLPIYIVASIISMYRFKKNN